MKKHRLGFIVVDVLSLSIGERRRRDDGQESQHEAQTGGGSRSGYKPMSVPRETFAANWDLAFGGDRPN